MFRFYTCCYPFHTSVTTYFDDVFHTHAKDEKCIQNFSQKENLKGRDHSKHLGGIDGRIILE